MADKTSGTSQVCFEFGSFASERKADWNPAINPELWSSHYYEFVHQPPFQDVTSTPGEWEVTVQYWMSDEVIFVEVEPPKDQRSNKLNYNTKRLVHDPGLDRFLFHEGTGQCVRMCHREAVIHSDLRQIQQFYDKKTTHQRRVFQLQDPDGSTFDFVFEKISHTSGTMEHRLEIRTARTPHTIVSAFEKIMDLIGRAYPPHVLHYNTRLMSNVFFVRQIMKVKNAAEAQQQQQQHAAASADVLHPGCERDVPPVLQEQND